MFKIFLNNFSCLFSNSIREGLRGQFRFFKISRRVQPFSLNNNDHKKKKKHEQNKTTETKPTDLRAENLSKYFGTDKN